MMRLHTARCQRTPGAVLGVGHRAAPWLQWHQQPSGANRHPAISVRHNQVSRQQMHHGISFSEMHRIASDRNSTLYHRALSMMKSSNTAIRHSSNSSSSHSQRPQTFNGFSLSPMFLTLALLIIAAAAASRQLHLDAAADRKLSLSLEESADSKTGKKDAASTNDSRKELKDASESGIEAGSQGTDASAVAEPPPWMVSADIYNVIRLVFRALHLAMIFFPIAVTTPWWIYVNRRILFSDSAALEDPSTLLVRGGWWARLLVWCLECAGPCFIKLGQYASSRTDVLPPAVCTVLAKLQSDGKAHSMTHTRKVFKAQFAVDIADVFEEFDENPVGVGSIAQVYKAKLRRVLETDANNGTHGDDCDDNDEGDSMNEHQLFNRACAVKVLHPGVRTQVADDLAIMHFVAQFINATIPDARWLSLPDEVSIFASMMTAQLDLSVEAQHLDTFSSNFKRVASVRFPRPVRPFVGPEVIVEEHVDAIPISKFLDMRSCYDKQIASIGIQAFLKMLIIDNFVHADLHPGNLLVSFDRPVKNFASRSLEFILAVFRLKASDRVTIEPSEAMAILSSPATPPNVWHSTLESLCRAGYSPVLTILDAGLVSTLSKANLNNLLDLLSAITVYDGAKVADLMISRSRDPSTCVDADRFRQDMRGLLTRVRSATLTLSRFKFGEILGNVFGMVRRSRVRIEGDFAAVGISVMLVEGVGRRLDDKVDLVAEAAPVLASVKKGEGSEAVSWLKSRGWEIGLSLWRLARWIKDKLELE